MPRVAARIDSNQPQIVKDLRKFGVSVHVLSAVGQGCPDLLCGWRGVNTLLEIKDGDKPESRHALTCDERDWHAKWAGQVAVVRNSKEAVDAIVAQTTKEAA